jgi:stage V sporulation protein AF
MVKKTKKKVGDSFQDNLAYMNQTLPVGESFDVIRRDMVIGGKKTLLFISLTVLQKMSLC